MLSNNKEQQKSPKRRFLLILGVAAFIGFCILGLGLIFWDDIPFDIPKTQRTISKDSLVEYLVLHDYINHTGNFEELRNLLFVDIFHFKNMIDFTIGIRFKVPNVIKKPNQRYNWL